MQKHFWSDEERVIFTLCKALFYNDFYSYTLYLKRSYSQIKSYYHNEISNSSYDKQLKENRGGTHKPYRNLVPQGNNSGINTQQKENKQDLVNLVFHLMKPSE
ncbi:Hypothetical_protein [Hexamita inflata]|uniref:Hypothetical_protein n=1 Tax=Hexamita inflata TaxID=28002 RepID=A0AA86NEI9_9EUKA|nr:Hypothetical protein HINF_LOCUS5982 [Hexamita inflata]